MSHHSHHQVRLQTLVALAACATVTLAGCDGAARGDDRVPEAPGIGVPTAADHAGGDGDSDGGGRTSSP